jgi:hypothetical protein
MKYSVETASYGMIYNPSFKEIGKNVQVIIRFFLKNLGSSNIGITDGRDLGITVCR